MFNRKYNYLCVISQVRLCSSLIVTSMMIRPHFMIINAEIQIFPKGFTNVFLALYVFLRIFTSTSHWVSQSRMFSLTSYEALKEISPSSSLRPMHCRTSVARDNGIMLRSMVTTEREHAQNYQIHWKFYK